MKEKEKLTKSPNNARDASFGLIFALPSEFKLLFEYIYVSVKKELKKQKKTHQWPLIMQHIWATRIVSTD